MIGDIIKCTVYCAGCGKGHEVPAQAYLEIECSCGWIIQIVPGPEVKARDSHISLNLDNPDPRLISYLVETA